MSIYIPVKLKNIVINRANQKCEYCLLPESLSYYAHHIEHIRSLKHGGKTISENLALSCPDCNSFKGTDLGTYYSV